MVHSRWSSSTSYTRRFWFSRRIFRWWSYCVELALKEKSHRLASVFTRPYYCDYISGGTVKDVVYRGNPLTIIALEDATCQNCAPSSGDTLRRGTDNLIRRLWHICWVIYAHFESLLMWCSLLMVRSPAAHSICVSCY